MNSILMYDWEKATLIRMVKKCTGNNRNGKRLLDVGCGYGRNLLALKSLCETCIGVDINPEIVRTNNEKGFVCYTPEELSNNVQKFDIILMSHVIEHFAPNDLLKFMDDYLDLLHPGGQLIIATPLMSSYFYDDFDHIKPYQPTGIMLMFGRKSSQVQYHSRHELILSDIWFRRSYYRISFNRSRYIYSLLSRVLAMLDYSSALLSFIFCGRIGRVDGWIGSFRKIR